ncbi:apolipoprotein C-I [Castor canadensis]|uniref:Apolipoprotein C-I n=1 Tax=Castor canadensis TaxID=51338 RepID=A0A8C0VWH2_CASCN
MRLFLSLPVLVVALCMALEGPAPAQASPDLSSALESFSGKLKEFGNTLEDKTRTAIDRIKQTEVYTKTRKWLSDIKQKAKEKFKDTFS